MEDTTKKKGAYIEAQEDELERIKAAYPGATITPVTGPSDLTAELMQLGRDLGDWRIRLQAAAKKCTGTTSATIAAHLDGIEAELVGLLQTNIEKHVAAQDGQF